MGIAASFETIAALPAERRLALVEAALRDGYPPLQAAAFALLADPAGLNRPDLLVLRYASLNTELRQRMSNQKDRFLPAAQALLASDREADRRAALSTLFALDPYGSAPAVAGALDDRAPVVREAAVAHLNELGERFYYHLVAARLHGDPESRAYLDAYGPRMLALLPLLTRLYPKHDRKVFFDIAIEAEPESYPFIVDHLLVRGAAPVRRAFLDALAASTTEQAVRILFRLSCERAGRMRETAAEVCRRRRDPGFHALIAATLYKMPPDEMSALAARLSEIPWWPEIEQLGDLDAASSSSLLEFAAMSGVAPRRRDELLLRFRRSPYPETRVKVLSLLQVLEHPRFPAIAEEALGDPHDDVKAAGARALIGLDPPNKAHLLMPLLNSGDEELRRLAMREVASAGVERYLKAFDRLDARTRETAVRALAKIDPRVVDRFLDELGGADPSRRLAALRAVAVLDAEAPNRERLLPLLADPDPRVRATALRVVKGGFERLVDALRDPDARARANAIESLEELADPRVAEVLRPCLDDPSPRARANAAKALLRHGRDEGRRALEAQLRHPDEAARRSAAWAIGRAGFDGARAQLMTRTEVETSPAVLEKIVEALARLA